MKCSVPGCDTNENVVSYTSVFFVCFPEDPVMQNQWISMLGITDTNVIHALITGELKVCSCHFAEHCFGRHHAYGYRYLLADALPTILPQQQSTECLPSEQLGLDEGSLDEDAQQNYYFIFESEVPSPDPEEVLEELKKGHNFDGQSDEEEGLEEIGIRYLDGKYYFFQLNDDPAEEETGAPEHVTTAQEPEEMDTLSDLEFDGCEPSEKFVDEFLPNTRDQTAFNNELHKAPNIGNEAEVAFADDLAEEHLEEAVDSERETESLVGDTDIERLDENVEETNVEASLVATIVNKNRTVLDEDATEHIADSVPDTESPIPGLIEALDEVSLNGGEAVVRKSFGKEKKHVCSVCGKGFLYPSALAKHVLIHTKTKPYSCEHCGKSFSQKSNLKVHMRQHTGERPEPRFSCEVCGRMMHRRSELRTHQVIHQKQYPIACPACDSRFAYVTTLYVHLRMEHKDKEISMEQVLKKFSENTKPQIIADKQYVAEDETVGPDGRWVCPVCNQTFAHVKLLRKHRRKLHPKIFRCKHCQRTFPYRSTLAKHMTVHTLEKRYKCHHCRGAFSQRINLKKHVQMKHGKLIDVAELIDEDDMLVEEKEDSKPVPYHCMRCNKSFFRQNTWLAHVEIHRTGDDQQPTCNQCNMTFASERSLQTHWRRMHRALDKLVFSRSDDIDEMFQVELNEEETEELEAQEEEYEQSYEQAGVSSFED